MSLNFSVLRFLNAEVVNEYAIIIVHVSAFRHHLAYLLYFLSTLNWMILSFNRFTHLLKLNPKGIRLSCIQAEVVCEEGFAFIAISMLVFKNEQDLYEWAWSLQSICYVRVYTFPPVGKVKSLNIPLERRCPQGYLPAPWAWFSDSIIIWENYFKKSPL